MPSERARRRIEDMLENITRTRAHVGGADIDAFLASPLMQDAVERCLERIAEAARKLGDAYDTEFPNVGLRELRAFGSVLRHDYHAIHPRLIWGFVERRLGPLETMAKTVLARLPED
jgi:uncharacterized protein with HEPN domain